MAKEAKKFESGDEPKAVVEPAKKRGPGRPKGSGKRRPGRPRKAGKAGKAVPATGRVTQREAKRLVKAAVAQFNAQLPKAIKKELRKLMK